MARQTVEMERLESVLAGRLDPDDAPAAVARLARLASDVAEHTAVEAAPDDVRLRLRAQLLEQMAAGEPTMVERARDRVDRATVGLRHSLRLAGATALASGLIGTGAVAAAAQSALPGDVLYPVKGFTESARMALASGDVDRGRLHLAFARERLDEAEAGVDRVAPDDLDAVLAQMDTEAASGAEELLAASAAEGVRPEQAEALRGELTTFTSTSRDRLADLAPRLPLSVRPSAERALEVLRRIDLQVEGLVDAATCAACGDGLSAVLPRVVLPGDGPAAGPRCDCAGPDLTPDTGGTTTGDRADEREPVDPTSSPAPRRQDPTTTTDPGPATDATGDVPVSTPSGDVSDVLEPVEDVGTLVDDLLGTEVGDTVEDLGGVVDDTVDDLGTTVEDTVDDLGTTVDDLGGVVDDTVGGLLGGGSGSSPSPGPSPSPSSSSSGGLLDGLLGGG